MLIKITSSVATQPNTDNSQGVQLHLSQTLKNVEGAVLNTKTPRGCSSPLDKNMGASFPQNSDISQGMTFHLSQTLKLLLVIFRENNTQPLKFCCKSVPWVL